LESATVLLRRIAVALVLVVATACSPRSGNPARIATGYISHLVCSYVFVSGLDPVGVGEEDIRANPVFRGFNWSLRYDVNLQDRRVTARTPGSLESHAVYRDSLGCLNLNGTGSPDVPTRGEIEADGPIPVLLPDIAGTTVVAPTDARLAAALDRAFAEPDGEVVRRTHAVVVVHDGHVVAERYAKGFGIDTPVHGWSATKSVNNALLGILVRQGRLRMDDPAPVAAWKASTDPRHAITPDHLLRMQSGLRLGDSLTAGFSSAWDTSARMMFTEPDMAGFAVDADLEAAPGTTWRYANGNPAILARIIRDLVGGHAVDVLRFARRELFGPLGIHRATLELDSTGTPIAGAFLFATPREWARVGLLFLQDGVVGGRRILPEGWVRYSTTPTPIAFVGYGAGWWINQGESRGARFRREHGMPADAFMAMGIYGQTVVVVPSARVVIARFGTTYDLPKAMIDICRLTADVVAALPGTARHETGRAALDSGRRSP
jgi:CubicO group peptidase (beta-lactamase class C family)